jgi:imidazolonepropionase-like amidohydrolase
LLLVTLATVAVLAGCGRGSKPPAPDGGSGPDTGAEPVEVTCRALPASANTCDVTPGNTKTLIEGTVLTPTTVYKGGQVAVDDTGKITCVGCDCAAGGETTISCPDAAISPGLINTHDHITYTHNAPYHDTGERYEDRQQWREGLDKHADIPAPGSATSEQVSWGELRFVMGGATSIVGSGGAAGFARNLDRATLQEGLGKKEVEFQTFPLGDSSGTRRTGDCNYGAAVADVDTAASLAAFDAYEPHTSEGIDATARNEFLCQSSATYDAMAPGVSNNLLMAKTAMIHGIGLTAADYGAMAAAGTGLIWSPRSNLTLYGDTARVTTAARAGVEIALGTDWTPTGSTSLLRELACADSFNATYLDHYFRDDQLWKMVTINAAALTATDDVLGVLATGKVADISIFAAHGKAPFRAVIEAEPKDVALVMRGGKVLYGDDAVVGALATSCDAVDVCGTGKRICAMGEVKMTYSELQTAAGAKLPSGTTALYPAFSCGVPANEPVCVPQRPVSVAGSTIYTGVPSATDGDGDGIPDATDNCPKTFNPIRPLDNGKQGDADGDGTGDACDPCPLDADTTTCSTVDAGDRDHDGVPNLTDNCPDLANPDQADDDHDGKGNACDVCPTDANAGSAGCPKSIYQVKSGVLAVGYVVRLTNALVTGRGSNGFFVQVKETETGLYNGADNSGLFVFTSAAPDAAIVAGTRVTIDGSIANFHNEIELDHVTATVVPGDLEAAPAPVPASYAEIKTGGSRAAALEGVIVTLGESVATAVDATISEVVVADTAANPVVIDDFAFAAPPMPLPAVGQGYTTIIGILALRQPGIAMSDAASLSKVLPRTASDLALGVPLLQSFGPAQSFARVNVTNNLPTFPLAQQLTVTLTGPAHGATDVAIVSGDPASLTVATVTIPDGVTSVAVPVTAVAAAADVTLTATLAAKSLSAHVRVLGETEAPTAVTLTPATSALTPLASVQLTATLDVPALDKVTVALDVVPAAAGTFPASVDIDPGQLSQTFTYVDAASPATATLTAHALGATSTATVLVTSVARHLVISQVYGGGGSSAANTPFSTDFIELHNPTSVSISLTGLSLQYASSSNATGAWSGLTVLGNAMVPAGGYFLVAEGTAGTAGAALPTPDVAGAINMSATAAKVALVSGTTQLASGCPKANMIDLVAYGTSTSACFEGSGATPALTGTTAAQRGPNGCSDTDDNKTDFSVGAPTPRNSGTSVVSCP